MPRTELQRSVERAKRRLMELKSDLESDPSLTRELFCDELKVINKRLRKVREDAPGDDPGRDAADAAVNRMDLLEGEQHDVKEVPGRYTAARRVGEIVEAVDQEQKNW